VGDGRTFGRMIPRPTSVGYARVISALGVPKGRWAEQNIVRLTNPETRQKMLDSNLQKVSITLIDIETGKEYSFVSLAKASKFTRSFASNNFRYIGINKLSYMKSGESYQGFLVEK
jgi:hypothetical protein